MFCECSGCQRTWRGCPWRPVSAPAGGAQRRPTWLTRSKRSSSVLPPNSYTLVESGFFLFFQSTTEMNPLNCWKHWNVSNLGGLFSQLKLRNLTKLYLTRLLGTQCFHGWYFSSLSLSRSHRQRVVPACYENVCFPLCSALYDWTSLLSSHLLSTPSRF